jgi:hypothetical protein
LRVTVPDDPGLDPGIQRIQLVRDVEVGDPARDVPLLRSNVSAFVLVPGITNVAPNLGPAGTTITVQGVRLLADAGPTLVVVGDRPFTPNPGATDTSVDVTVSGLSPGTYRVSVRVAGAESVDLELFEVTP